MKVVVGLGNPGPKYQGTRHNIGVQVLAELSRRHAASQPKIKFDAEIAETTFAGEKLLLVAPQTFMNASGRAVRRIVDFFDQSFENLLIVCDDLNLPTSRLRIRPSGSAGGQKGLLDIINRLGSEAFPRLRIGIGQPPARLDASAYVLARFRADEIEGIEHAVMLAADGVEIWVRDGVEAAMNRVNTPTNP
jgi:PTH1 family peptidyl-tRNA hydrolase